MRVRSHRLHRRPWVVTAVASMVVLGVPPMSSAGIGSTCSFDESSGVATVDVAADDVIALARAGDAITLDGVACQAATVTNTDLVDIIAIEMTATETVVIDLSGGPLAPGITDEGDGSSEIEIGIDLKELVQDEIRVVGTPGDDAITGGLVLVGPRHVEPQRGRGDLRLRRDGL